MRGLRKGRVVRVDDAEDGGGQNKDLLRDGEGVEEEREGEEEEEGEGEEHGGGAGRGVRERQGWSESKQMKKERKNEQYLYKLATPSGGRPGES